MGWTFSSDVGREEKTYKMVSKRLGKWLLTSPRQRCEENIKIDRNEIGRENGSGWNWLRIVSSGRFWYQRC